jgi:hypothetical protein
MTDTPAHEPLPGSPPPYVFRYGRLVGLTERMAALCKRCRENDGRPFVGLGIIADLELVMRLLNLREYAEWLQVHGDDDQRRWAADIIDLQDRDEDNEQCFADIERVVPVGDDQPYAEAVGDVARKAVQYDVVRAILVNVGAIAPDDTAADVPGMIRALLS